MEQWIGIRSFLEPKWLLAIPLIAMSSYLLFLWKRHRKIPSGVFAPSLKVFAKIKRRSTPLRYGGLFFRSLALIFLVIALARPQGGRRLGARSAEGVDIVLVVDTSGSMKAQDFEIDGKRPNRLQVIKQVISRFIEARPDDRIGLVVFGTEAFTQAPLTLDHDVLIKFLDQIEIGIAGEATAIGDGLATAVARLKNQPGESRVVVLLTDGTNNAGRVDPLAAASAAKTLEVRVHTIGVGSDGEVPIIMNGQVAHIRADIDEKLLTKIADETGGIYRRAVDTKGLVSVYEEIDRLEKRRIEVKDQRGGRDLFYLPLLAAIICLALELAWSTTRWRTIP